MKLIQGHFFVRCVQFARKTILNIIVKNKNRNLVKKSQYRLQQTLLKCVCVNLSSYEYVKKSL
jgi:hypothetical protein